MFIFLAESAWGEVVGGIVAVVLIIFIFGGEAIGDVIKEWRASKREKAGDGKKAEGRFCEECGADCKKSAKHCAKCGAKL